MSNIIDRDADLSICQAADELERLRAENARKSAQSTRQWEAGMGKWTQGPWKFEAVLGCKQIRGGKNGQHRQAQYSDIAYTVGRNDEDEDAANARLIAAAPELAEALEMVVAADTAEDWSRAVDYARAALAKAGVE